MHGAIVQITNPFAGEIHNKSRVVKLVPEHAYREILFDSERLSGRQLHAFKARFAEKIHHSFIFSLLEDHDDLSVDENRLVLSEKPDGKVVWMLMGDPNEIRLVEHAFNVVLWIFIQEAPSPMKSLTFIPGIRQHRLVLTFDEYGRMIDQRDAVLVHVRPQRFCPCRLVPPVIELSVWPPCSIPVRHEVSGSPNPARRSHVQSD
jgi:hypothetical protein